MLGMQRLLKSLTRERRGSITVEFIVVLPLVIMAALLVWQMAVAGLAVMDTQVAIRDAVRVAATTGNTEKAEAHGRESFGKSSYYRLKEFKVEIKDGKAIAQGKTTIDLVFLPNSKDFFTYNQKSETPVIE